VAKPHARTLAEAHDRKRRSVQLGDLKARHISKSAFGVAH